MSLKDNPILFSDFCLLLSKIRSLSPHSSSTRPSHSHFRARENKGRKGKTPLELVQSWVGHIRDGRGGRLPFGTTMVFLRLFFPHEGVRRRYGLAEPSLVKQLAKIFKTKDKSFSKWADNGEDWRGKHGCLGIEVEDWMYDKGFEREDVKDRLTLGRIDELLDELASLCEYSSIYGSHHLLPPILATLLKGFTVSSTPTRTTRRTQSEILTSLFSPLSHSPSQIGFLIRIILRDLSPILYPLPTLEGSKALLSYNTLSWEEVKVSEVLRGFDETRGLEYVWRTRADLDVVASFADQESITEDDLKPLIGVPVQIPKSLRPGLCSQATKHLNGLTAIETKYDGERVQVHIDLSLSRRKEQIKIFSKSGRDSTDTRWALIPIIRAALGLPMTYEDHSIHPLLHSRLPRDPSSPLPLFTSTAQIPSRSQLPTHPPIKMILEGEMVPYNEYTGRIDEFWTLRGAKTARAGLGRKGYAGECEEEGREEEEWDSQSTGATQTPRWSGSTNGGRGEEGPREERHLMMVWFDVLLVEGKSYLDQPYEERRERLETLVTEIDGFSMLAKSKVFDFSKRERALGELRDHFAHIIVDRGEGLMLKPLDSPYNSPRLSDRWVKLKKDFIPGAGDTHDFIVIGARWEKERGRKLKVPTSVLSTFFVGFETDRGHYGEFPTRGGKKHYHIVFSTSYGLDRQKLCALNYELREKSRLSFPSNDLHEMNKAGFTVGGVGGPAVYDHPDASYTFSMAESVLAAGQRPQWMFCEPKIFELNGAGFQMAPGAKYYELRWPRIIKTRSESDGDPLTLRRMMEVASKAVDIASDDDARFISQLFAPLAGNKRTVQGDWKYEVCEWKKRLEIADGVLSRDEGKQKVSQESKRIAPSNRVTRAPSCSPPGLLPPPTNLSSSSPVSRDSSAPYTSPPTSPLQGAQEICPPSFVVDAHDSLMSSSSMPRTPSPRVRRNTANLSSQSFGYARELTYSQNPNRRPRDETVSSDSPPTHQPDTKSDEDEHTSLSQPIETIVLSDDDDEEEDDEINGDLTPAPLVQPSNRALRPLQHSESVPSALLTTRKSDSALPPAKRIRREEMRRTVSLPLARSATASEMFWAAVSLESNMEFPAELELVEKDRLQNPEDVLWAAGWVFDDPKGRKAFPGRLRDGYILFGAPGGREWLAKILKKARTGRAPVTFMNYDKATASWETLSVVVR